MSMALSVGTRLPAFHTSLGRIQLGFLDDAEIWRRLKSLRIEPYTPSTITDLQALFDRIRADHARASPSSTRSWSAGCARSRCRSSTARARRWRRHQRLAPTRRARRATRCASSFLPELQPLRGSRRHRVTGLEADIAALVFGEVRAYRLVRKSHRSFDNRTATGEAQEMAVEAAGSKVAGTKPRSQAEDIGKVTVDARRRPARNILEVASRDGREVYIYGERVKDVTDASRPSATPRAWSRASTTRCTTPSARTSSCCRPTPATAA